MQFFIFKMGQGIPNWKIIEITFSYFKSMYFEQYNGHIQCHREPVKQHSSLDFDVFLLNVSVLMSITCIIFSLFLMCLH